MDIQHNSTPLNYVCKGCLSMDRKVGTIYDVECKQIYLEFLNNTDQFNQELQLCWECSARLRSVVQFKHRVQTAHDCLVRYMFQHTHITSLTTLVKTSNNIDHQQIDDDKSSLTEIIPKPDATSSSELDNSTSEIIHFSIPQDQKPNLLSETDYSEVNTNKYFIDNTDVRDNNLKESEPIFVKIEDNEFDLDGHFYVDESIDHSVQDDDDKVNVTPESQEVVLSKKGKSKKKKRTKVQFDDSDDEPLKSKKVKRGRPNKEGTGAEKKRKREKPAGVVSNSRVHRNLQQLNLAEGQVEMVVLSWEEVEAERVQARESPTFTRHAHRCEDCVLGFNHRIKLDAHMQKHKPEAGPAECPVCRVRCRDDHALVAHKRRHRVRWRCVVCGECASRAAVAADHAARLHGATPTHACRRCPATLESLAKLRNHMKNHAERQKCELCGKTFRDRTSLRTHLFIHRGEKEYSCPHCEKRFLFKKAMEVHLVTHAAPAQLYCLECDMTFKNRMSYYQHKKYNLKHVDPAMLKHQCSLCDKKFLKAARLQEHNFAVHLKVTPIRCTVPECDFACSSRPVLRTHVRMVHRNARAARNHVCHTCGKAYTTKKTLEGHMRSHTGERPFHCRLCPSTFSYEAALYNHNRLVHLKPKMDQAANTVPS